MNTHAHTHFIDGAWTPADSREPLPVIDPATGGVFATIARGGSRDIDLAVRAARRAADGAWGAMPAFERGRILSRLGRRVMEQHESLAQLEARDTGKPISQARNDIAVAARYCEFYGGAADKVLGQQIPYLPGFHVTVTREPLGVTAHILPWNYPAQMFGRSVVPSLAMGNAVVLKPSEDACMLPLRLAELASAAGLPPGALNVVTGLGEEAGAALSRHDDIDFITFTGSPEVGTLVQEAAAQRTIKCVLELGGKSPQIVFEDADFEAAANSVVKAITQNAGQTCSAGSRLLIQHSVYEKFIEIVAAKFRRSRAGPPGSDCDCGPLINRSQLARVRAFVADAQGDGVAVLAQGTVEAEAGTGGYYFPPVLLGPVPRDHRLATHEVFGPVLAAMPFDDEADAVSLANSTDFGLLAGIWTRDAGRLARMGRKMKCGQVYLNCYGAGGGVELPFGGVKRSGHGREKGLLALEEFCAIKTTVQFVGA